MVPDGLYYTKEHEWVKLDGEIGIVGITDYAQGELGDIVMLDLPKAGTKVVQMRSLGTIEAVKAVSDIYSPISGEVVEVNEAAISNPALVNQDPYNAGWLVKIRIEKPEELKNLLSAEDYRKLIGEA
jgi:glycine cleavage system H protein